jgi:hypothetical protein
VGRGWAVAMGRPKRTVLILIEIKIFKPNQLQTLKSLSYVALKFSIKI